ncbi:prdh-1 [Pristionchus pacificus]|uniref:Proline dehydrogenase n=1 Tax=Pristionchus pacificus TaxID=54126 RepID=A0A2A6CBI3_PRIPA|nr:prdh-1 [Pristionchus pacificus]|eukprot:PDM75534.1 hypothetical protein PRIPAC_42711 [Pristionchus pacificus]
MRLLVAGRHMSRSPTVARLLASQASPPASGQPPPSPSSPSSPPSPPTTFAPVNAALAKEIEDKFAALDPTFRNTKEAFKSKSNLDLIRALVVLKMCAIKPLVQHNQAILATMRRILGKNLFKKALKNSFYGHFVAGETTEEVGHTIERLKRFGVKSILDYSVESDLSHDEAEQKTNATSSMEAEVSPPAIVDTGVVDSATVDLTHERYSAHKDFADRRVNVHAARTYIYEGEKACDVNRDVFCESIDAVAKASGGEGFAAIKITALGRPALLLRLSESIAQTHNFFKNFGVKIDKDITEQWFETVDFDRDGLVDFHGWDQLLEDNQKLGQMFKVLNIKTGKLEPLIQNLTPQEEQEFTNMIQRTVEVAEYGIARGIRLMVDAEQTYFQPAISRMAVAMMKKYNKDRGNIFNTYQAYLRNALDDMECDMQKARREGWHFGAKLVRGAYMDQERARAAAIGYEDPINENYEATGRQYERCLTRIADELARRGRGNVSVMIASHNEDTVRFATKLMRDRGIAPSERIMCFAQLYGMCDQVSFSLGQAGYSVYKYLPYGPVEDVLPYLSRRALENGSVLEKAKVERGMLSSELRRRISNGQFSYKP